MPTTTPPVSDDAVTGELADFLLAGLDDPSPASPPGVARWLQQNGRLGQPAVATLAAADLLAPRAVRVIAAARASGLPLPGMGVLFTPAGTGWADEHFLSPAAEPSGMDGRPVPLGGEWAAEQQAFGDVGARTVGPYRLFEGVGCGAGSVVYAAESVFGGPRVAVKLLHAEGAGSRERAGRLLDGAAAAARLGLPGLLPVHAAGWEDGRAYLAMPLVGPSAQAAHECRRLSPADATAICGRAARALSALHTAGLTHGNVKASNLLLGGGDVLLSDPVYPNAGGSAGRAADVAALVQVYAGLLSGAPEGPAACRDLTRVEFPSAADLTDALGAVAAHLSDGRPRPGGPRRVADRVGRGTRDRYHAGRLAA